MRIGVFIVLVFIAYFSMFPQAIENKQIDNDLKLAKTDTVKIKILFKAGENLMISNSQKAFTYLIQALEISKSINNTNWSRLICSYIGTNCNNMHKLQEALFYDQEALKFALKLKNKNVIAQMYDCVAFDYYNLSDFSKALNYSLKSLKISEEINDQTSMSNTYNTVGSIYLMLKNNELSVLNFEKSLQLFITLKDSFRIAATYENIASVYATMNISEKTLQNSFMALNIREKIFDTVGKGYCYLNIGDVYFKNRNSDSAQKYISLALNIFSKAREAPGATAAYLNMANLYYEKGNFEKALVNLENGFNIAKEVKDLPNQLYSYKTFADIYYKKKDYQKAYDYQKLYTILNDSLFKIDRNKQMAEMQIKYDTEKKEKEIDKLTNQNQIQQLQISRNWYLIFGLSATVILILIIAVLLSGQSKLKANQTKMEVEQKLFRSQMNPHFIFNSLIAIQNYVFKHQPAEVAKYISSFAKLMRMILENSRNEYVSIEKELDTLKYYLELQQLRFHEKFDFKIEVDPDIDIEAVSIPPMLSQPFIENAIEHGIMKKPDGKGLIVLKFLQKDKMIEMIVEDNGIGIENSLKNKQQSDKKHNSLATTITEERLAILNKKSKQKFSLKIINLKNDQGFSIGTQVSITMPEA